jgi:hypothetical protein
MIASPEPPSSDPGEPDSGWLYPPAMDLPPVPEPPPLYPVVLALLGAAAAGAEFVWLVVQAAD